MKNKSTWDTLWNNRTHGTKKAERYTVKFAICHLGHDLPEGSRWDWLACLSLLPGKASVAYLGPHCRCTADSRCPLPNTTALIWLQVCKPSDRQRHDCEEEMAFPVQLLAGRGLGPLRAWSGLHTRLQEGALFLQVQLFMQTLMRA